jgi:hypothetical protein
MMKDSKELKLKIIAAGYKAVEELIKVAEESITSGKSDGSYDDESSEKLAADRLKNAAATKKLAIFDAFEILNRIEAEDESIKSIERGEKSSSTKQGFAERRSRQ